MIARLARRTLLCLLLAVQPALAADVVLAFTMAGQWGEGEPEWARWVRTVVL